MPNLYVNILHYIDYDNSEELVSYGIDLQESLDYIISENSEVVSMLKKATDNFTDEDMLIKSIISFEVVSIMQKEIMRTIDEKKPFTDKIAEIVDAFVKDDYLETVSIDFGEKKNMILELEKVY